jgi:hypothetical protein
MTKTVEQRTPAQQRLAEILSNASKDHKGMTNVWAKVEHVSQSGMSRSIKLYVVIDGNISDITGYAAEALEQKRDRYWGITVKGCGMDMCHHLIDSVSYRVFGTDLYKNFSYRSL